MASIGRLLASVVHEINTPIGSILSNNEVVVRSLDKLKSVLDNPGEGSLDQAKSIVETCRSLAAVDKIACERIVSVVRGLKAFARAEDGEFQKADLQQALRDTLKLAHCEFRKRITVALDFGEIPLVECRPQMLNQVFLNLLVNAGQAIPDEGKVTVRARREDDRVHISICDTGRGIQPQDRAKIFVAGFTTKPVGVGTGLGLAISKKIIEEVHGGKLDYESEVGAGTTFHIHIPIQRPLTPNPS